MPVLLFYVPNTSGDATVDVSWGEYSLPLVLILLSTAAHLFQVQYVMHEMEQRLLSLCIANRQRMCNSLISCLFSCDTIFSSSPQKCERFSLQYIVSKRLVGIGSDFLLWHSYIGGSQSRGTQMDGQGRKRTDVEGTGCVVEAKLQFLPWEPIQSSAAASRLWLAETGLSWTVLGMLRRRLFILEVDAFTRAEIKIDEAVWQSVTLYFVTKQISFCPSGNALLSANFLHDMGVLHKSP